MHKPVKINSLLTSNPTFKTCKEQKLNNHITEGNILQINKK